MTDENQAVSWNTLADKYHLEKNTYGNGSIFRFPSHWSNGWIAEMHPTDGLFVASAWFTPEINIVHTVQTDKPCMWILCIDCGDIIYSQQGKRAKKLTPITHVITNPSRKFQLTFPKGVHFCFTSVLVFDDFINSYLQDRQDPPKVTIDDAKKWDTQHYNTPNTMLILEQIRWAVRNADMPLLAYEGMVMHLLSAISCNYPTISKHRSNRRHYVTWENQQKIYRVKDRIDQNILNVPNLDEMCRLSDMSASKLRLTFRNTYNIPLYDYIRTETMKRAMQLLASDHLSIRNIADQCGYKNAAKFAAAFKDVHGITPSEFRKAFNL